MKKLSYLMVLALLLTMVLTGCVPTSTEFDAIVIKATVDPPSFTGACPLSKTFNFSAVIFAVNGPGTVTYRWERSDGAIGPIESITFAEGGGTQTVETSWTVGISYSGWKRVHILTPSDSLSDKANFTLTCVEGFAITSVTASVDPPSFTGACPLPKKFNFYAVIEVNGPGTVTYRWERNDVWSIGPTESITFAEAGSQTVTDLWYMQASYSGWERVHILTPNDTFSNKANFTVTCVEGFAINSVTASVDPSSFTGLCPKTFNFSAVIEVNGPGTVTYQWERSDGSTGPTESITFAEAGAQAQTVTRSWTTLGSSSGGVWTSYSGWQRVHILTPNDTFSNKANFTLNCIPFI